MVRLVRREPAAVTESEWDPDGGQIDPDVLDDVDAVVNLSGVGIADRPLTAKRKTIVRSSRINSTRTLVRALTARHSGTGSAPALIQSSATGWYPTEGSQQPLTEDTASGSGWIARLVADWEQEARPAADAGVRVVWMRTSPVLGADGGMLPLMRRAWSLGAGAQLGDGRQHMPIVQLQDYLDFVLWAAGNDQASGPYNLTIPEPTTNGEFSDELASQLHRPRILRAPSKLLSVALGDLADQLLGDVWLVPKRATDAGFTFGAPDVTAAIRASLHH